MVRILNFQEIFPGVLSVWKLRNFRFFLSFFRIEKKLEFSSGNDQNLRLFNEFCRHESLKKFNRLELF